MARKVLLQVLRVVGLGREGGKNKAAWGAQR